MSSDIHNHASGAVSSSSMNRRTFVQAVLAGTGMAAIGHSALGAEETRPSPPVLTAGSDDWLKLTGYADRFSVQAGEKIRFMVSTEQPRFRADLVRLIHGDVNPKGPGFKERDITSTVSGDYPGTAKSLRAGSYVTVPDAAALRLRGSFSLQAWVAASMPGKGAQGVLTKWSASEQKGYALVIEADGCLALWIGRGPGQVEVVKTEAPLRAFIPADVFEQLNYPVGQMGTTQSWYFVAATFDAATGKAVLYQEPVAEWPLDKSERLAGRVLAAGGPAENSLPLLMAAYWRQHAGLDGVTGGHFNGKIAAPAIFNRALSPQEITAIRQGGPCAGAVGVWDFSRDIDSRRITDVSGNRLHGQTVNMPARAMTGPNWSARELRFTDARHEYGAIYFHDDDLDDARWAPDIEFAVPDSLPSGVYALRTRAGGREDHIPFFVRPKKGTAIASIAVLFPTFTYLAYGNLRAGVPELLSLYSRHADGSGVMYASRLRPLRQFRPQYHERVEKYVRHLGADLYLVDWLEAKGIPYDVLTDDDLDAEGESLLRPYRAIVTGSHPEYTSTPMLNALESYLHGGGRMMYLGGNGFYWVATRSPDDDTVLELRRNHGTELWATAPGEYYHSTTGELGGLWRFRGRPPQKYFGVGFAALGGGPGRPYRRQAGGFDPRAQFIFEGIGPEELIGDHPALVRQHGAASDEIDRFEPALGSPPHALVLATASGFDDSFQPATEEVLLSDPRLGGKTNPEVRADMVFFEGPKGGAVFSVGSMSWVSVLSHNQYNNTVSRVTENVLRRFASKEPWPEVRA